MKQVLQKSILPNHNIYIYNYDNLEEASIQLAIITRLKKRFKLKHPKGRFEIQIQLKSNKATITLEVWTSPLLLMN